MCGGVLGGGERAGVRGWCMWGFVLLVGGCRRLRGGLDLWLLCWLSGESAVGGGRSVGGERFGRMVVAGPV